MRTKFTTRSPIFRNFYDFVEKLEKAGIEGSEVKVIKAYQGLELQADIAAASSSLFLTGHYAEAVEKAMKAFNELIRTKCGSKLDGFKFMESVFSANDLVLALNSLSDISDRDEQKGFMLMASGAALCIRNPRAHKIIDDEAAWALEAIAFISFMAK